MSFLVQTDIALAPKTTLKTGGSAAYYVEVENIEELEKAVYFAEQNKRPFFILGGGSNILVSDEGYAGLVIKMNMKGLTYTEMNTNEVRLTAGAGEVFDEVVEATVERTLWGLENLSHIPGSVGATPVQNVGAYGVEVADTIFEVTVFDTEIKKIIIFKNSDCNFLYRHSIFKDKKNLIIISVTFILSTFPNPKLTYTDLRNLSQLNLIPQQVRTAVIAIRAEKFPDWTIVGTAGSFFKNPIISEDEGKVLLSKYPDIPTYLATEGMVKVSLGYILDKVCDLKGFGIGAVSLYKKQALVLVALPTATTTDIKNFKEIISEKVFEKTLIKIEQEVTEI